MQKAFWYLGRLNLGFIMYFSGLGVLAQEEGTAYYVNVNDANQSKVFEVQDKKVALQYHDYNGQWKEMLLTIYDWRRTQLVQLKLSKSFGLNNFIIDLNETKIKWELNNIYTFEILAENNQKFEILIKLIPTPEKAGLEANIRVVPVQFKCDELSSKLMEFYGDINGGKPPYKVQWYILNDSRTDFIYQPREERIETAGQTMVVQVDKAPSYNVMLYVTDACGGLQKKMVHVVCEDGKKKINTVFIEPLSKTLIDKVNAAKN